MSSLEPNTHNSIKITISKGVSWGIFLYGPLNCKICVLFDTLIIFIYSAPSYLGFAIIEMHSISKKAHKISDGACL